MSGEVLNEGFVAQLTMEKLQSPEIEHYGRTK